MTGGKMLTRTLPPAFNRLAQYVYVTKRYTVPAMTTKDQGLVTKTGTFVSTFIDPVARQTPSANETRGDDRIDEARKAAIEYESVIDAKDRAAIEDRIN